MTLFGLTISSGTTNYKGITVAGKTGIRTDCLTRVYGKGKIQAVMVTVYPVAGFLYPFRWIVWLPHRSSCSG